MILGAGHSGIDAARTALRLGADSVHMVDPFSQEQMPYAPEETKELEEEGAKVLFQSAPRRVVIENDRIVGVECYRTRLTEADTHGA